MIYSTQKRKHRKTGKHYRNMRGGGETDLLIQFVVGFSVVGVLMFCLIYFSKGGHSGSKSL